MTIIPLNSKIVSSAYYLLEILEKLMKDENSNSLCGSER